jgi:hypothetical protein
MPNTYYVGMSSLALQLLYRLFNADEQVVCERIFSEKNAAQAGKPLPFARKRSPCHRFCSVGLHHFLGDGLFQRGRAAASVGDPAARRRTLPARSSGTGSPWPLPIAAGPGVTMNPEPVAPFLDAILIGEGEEALPHFLDLCRRRAGRPERAAG